MPAIGANVGAAAASPPARPPPPAPPRPAAAPPPPLQPDRADARVDDVLQRGFRALIRHAAEAVGDRADRHAVEHRIRLGLKESRAGKAFLEEGNAWQRRQ